MTDLYIDITHTDTTRDNQMIGVQDVILQVLFAL